MSLAGMEGLSAPKAIMAPGFPSLCHREKQLVPYKDPETRRRYDREYKRRLRAQKRLTHPGQTGVRKAYICLKFPHLRLPGIAFRDGWFITDKRDEQAKIEQHPSYGREIFSWRLEP
jgi:hypothetical protein